MESEYESAPRLSNGTVWMTFSDLFKVVIIQVKKLENGTAYSYILTYNGWSRESRIWSIERRHLQWHWTTHTLSFKVTPFFDAEYLRNGTTYRHSVIEIPIGTYTRPTQQCHFEWSWVILSDLAKYSMTWHEALRGLSYHIIISPGLTKAPLIQCSTASYNTIDRVE